MQSEPPARGLYSCQSFTFFLGQFAQVKTSNSSPVAASLQSLGRSASIVHEPKTHFIYLTGICSIRIANIHMHLFQTIIVRNTCMHPFKIKSPKLFDFLANSTGNVRRISLPLDFQLQRRRGCTAGSSKAELSSMIASCQGNGSNICTCMMNEHACITRFRLAILFPAWTKALPCPRTLMPLLPLVDLAGIPQDPQSGASKAMAPGATINAKYTATLRKQ